MIMLVGDVNAVHIRAILPPAMGVSSMDKGQFDREMKYQVSMSIVRNMLEKGLIRPDDVPRWQQRLIALYDPPIGRIVSNPKG